MHRIDRVLLRLQPVARQLGEYDLGDSVLPGKRFPHWIDRCRSWPEVGEEHSGERLDGIGNLGDCVTKPAVPSNRLFEWRTNALAVLVKGPPVITASKPTLFDIAIRQIRS